MAGIGAGEVPKEGDDNREEDSGVEEEVAKVKVDKRERVVRN